jgi:hypothetical protein
MEGGTAYDSVLNIGRVTATSAYVFLLIFNFFLYLIDSSHVPVLSVSSAHFRDGCCALLNHEILCYCLQTLRDLTGLAHISSLTEKPPFFKKTVFTPIVFVVV